MSDVVLSDEQRGVLDQMENTLDHVFITGRAGTGKSTLLQAFVASTAKVVAVCAPTGVAALAVGGQTIHSLLR
ncbi:MAG: AAA family ATPase, partial [Pontimonas sp.]|nr:AAA family ATPase [Pontimonas sp.]